MSIFGTSLFHDLLAIIAILFFGIVANLFSIQVSKKLDLIDYPDNSGLKIQKKPTPLSGGLAIFLTMIVFFVTQSIFNSSYRIELVYLLPIFFLVVVIGMFDDRLRLSYKTRLFFYLVFTTLIYLILAGSQNMAIVWIILLIFLFAPGIITAVNMIDGMDGLCVSVSIISLIAFAAIGLNDNNQLLVLMSSAGVVAGLAFFLFNFYPASIFLGSSGSELIGFLMLVLVVISMQNVPGYLLPFRILIIGIPVLDLIRVLIIRIKNKKSLMSGDRNHIYDRLLNRGLGQKKVWSIMIVSQIILVSLAFVLNNLLIK